MTKKTAKNKFDSLVTVQNMALLHIVPLRRDGHGYDCGHPDCEVTAWQCRDCSFEFLDISLEMARRHRQDHQRYGKDVVVGNTTQTATIVEERILTDAEIANMTFPPRVDHGTWSHNGPPDPHCIACVEQGKCNGVTVYGLLAGGGRM